MKENVKRQIKVSPEVHKEIAHESIERDIGMQTLVETAWALYKRDPGQQYSPLTPTVPIADELRKLTASNERLHSLIQAKVVQVQNQQEKELLERINRNLHVTGFQKQLLDLVKKVELERKPVIHGGRKEGSA